MKKLLLLALCALLSANADARTLYVNAKRPNNKGNGLSVKKAKKTLQAAINVARKGDTILVYPGTYAPIKTNNKKIAIKAKKGKKKTVIGAPATITKSVCLARLGKVQKTQVVSGGTLVTRVSPIAKGRSTALTGFSIDGRDVYGLVERSEDVDESTCVTTIVYPDYADELVGVTGGTLKSCTIRNIGHDTFTSEAGVCVDGESWNCLFSVANSSLKKCLVQGHYSGGQGNMITNSTLTACTIQSNNGCIVGSTLADCTIRTNFLQGIRESTMNRCTIRENDISQAGIDSCTLCNCLVAGNSGHDHLLFESKLYNCTIIKNMIADYASDGSVNALSANSKYYNSICWGNQMRHWCMEYFFGKTDELGNARWIRVYNEGDSWCEIDIAGQRLENQKNESGTLILGSSGELYDKEDGYEAFDYTMRAEVDLSTYSLCNASNDGNTYKNTYAKKANPKFKNTDKGDYRLKKGSPCINKGKLTEAQKTLVGTKDLAGKKRIKGKAVDQGCYER